MAKDDLVRRLVARRKDLDAEKRELESQIGKINELTSIIDETILSCLDSPEADYATGSAPNAELGTETGTALDPETLVELDAESFDGLTVQDIAHCKDVNEALETMARLKGGFLKYREGAKLLMRAGLYEERSVDAAAASIQSRLRDRRDWTTGDRGFLNYLPAMAPDGAEAKSQTIYESPDLSTEPSSGAQL